MRITIQGVAASLLSLAVLMPGLAYAQGGALDAIGLGAIGGGAPGAQGSEAGLDLSCQGRGADGGLACGDVAAEDGARLCVDKDKDYVCDDKDECLDTPAGTPVFANGCHTVELVEGKPLILRGVNFDFDKASLTSESEPILQQAVAVLNAQPELLVSIDGHTDSKGEERYNENLSRERAKTVYQYFLDAGISADRLIYRGFGESNPIAANTRDDGSDNPSGRAENRRVELSVVSPETFNEIKQQIAAEEEARARREAELARQRALAAEQAREAEETADEEEAEAEATGEQPAAETAEPGSFDESEYLDFLSPQDQEVIEEETEQIEPSEEAPSDSSAEQGADTEQGAESEPAAEGEGASEGEFDESEYLEFLDEVDAGEDDAAAGSTDTSGN